jgi:small nuclear ribonucleoprotein E
LQNATRVQIWLFENTNIRIEGKIIGFDEYMNLTIDEAEEVNKKTQKRKALGKLTIMPIE